MSQLFHECGVAAIFHLPGQGISPLCPPQGPEQISRLMPRMLLDIQNRGQLSAGISSFSPDRSQRIDTHKELGGVGEVFRLSHRGKSESLMQRYAGRAAIGHVRYATCGSEDRSYAQPFERHHLQKRKWFSFAFNGQLANYVQLRDRLLADSDHHLTRETDTEIVMHEISRELSGDRQPALIDVLRNIAHRFDGAYCLTLLNAVGEMLVARDPLGIRPLSYVREGPLFAAASESVALLNLGFAPENVKSLPPGQAVIIADDRLEVHQFGSSARRAHCFFEWIYFANVASTMDGRSVYLARTSLGQELARLETLTIDNETIVVPVPDTSKAAADAMAFKLGVPSLEGLIRNRYTGRTFIEGGGGRKAKAETKYTPLREVLEGKRVLLVEDSIVRSTTMRVLLERIRTIGRAREVHVRVACPPIISPCFYGIDMSTIGELFAPQFQVRQRRGGSDRHGSHTSADERLPDGWLTDEVQAAMAADLGADSLRYLPVESIARAIQKDADQLCQACIIGRYPTPCGRELHRVALSNAWNEKGGRTYERSALGTDALRPAP